MIPFGERLSEHRYIMLKRWCRFTLGADCERDSRIRVLIGIALLGLLNILWAYDPLFFAVELFLKQTISDRDPKFLSEFKRQILVHMDTKLLYSTAWHLQTDEQSERNDPDSGIA
jgi:hypothetical protein